MSANIAHYACDECRHRKVTCTREISQCQRCKRGDIVCVYSRSGVIRRTRKRKHAALVSDRSKTDRANDDPTTCEGGGAGIQSQLSQDIEKARDHLSVQNNSTHNPLSALSALSEACAAVWHDASEFDKIGKTFFLFEDYAVSWTQTFVHTLDRGRPLFSSAPREVLSLLKAARPHQVRDRAWLVMFYSVVLSMVSSTTPEDESTKAKLRCNLWLALNDVRLLLEPSEANIQALALLACHVEEFTTPSLSWMLVTNACRMLQALGINHRRLDAQTRERRLMIFWHLNLLDQGMALIFGRPPSFNRKMVSEMAFPSMEQLLPFRPHVTSAGGSSLFGAHYIHQAMLLSRIMSEIWNCVHGELSTNEEHIKVASEALDSWYEKAQKLLEAAALVEKPFLDTRSSTSIDLGLHHLNYSYHYLFVLLIRSSDQMKPQCLRASKNMLHLLEHMVSDSEEPYNGIIWQLLCGPFTAFLTLFGEVVSNRQSGGEGTEEILVAMARLPVFLGEMRRRNSLAGKLERIAVVVLQHARSVVQPDGKFPDCQAQITNTDERNGPNMPPTSEDKSDWNSFLNHAMTELLTNPTSTTEDMLPGNWNEWTNDLFGDAIIDWVGWDNES